MSASLNSLMSAAASPAPKREKTGDLFNLVGVGAVGALAYVVVSSALIWLHSGVADWLVSTLGYAVLILPISMMHHRHLFSSNAAHNKARLGYLGGQGVALVLAAGFSYGAHEALALPTVVASIVVLVLTASVNYVVQPGRAFAGRHARVMLPA